MNNLVDIYIYTYFIKSVILLITSTLLVVKAENIHQTTSTLYKMMETEFSF